MENYKNNYNMANINKSTSINDCNMNKNMSSLKNYGVRKNVNFVVNMNLETSIVTRSDDGGIKYLVKPEQPFERGTVIVYDKDFETEMTEDEDEFLGNEKRKRNERDIYNDNNDNDYDRISDYDKINDYKKDNDYYKDNNYNKDNDYDNDYYKDSNKTNNVIIQSSRIIDSPYEKNVYDTNFTRTSKSKTKEKDKNYNPTKNSNMKTINTCKRYKSSSSNDYVNVHAHTKEGLTDSKKNRQKYNK